MEEGQATAELKPLFTLQEEETAETDETESHAIPLFDLHDLYAVQERYVSLPELGDRTFAEIMGSSWTENSCIISPIPRLYRLFADLNTINVTAWTGETFKLNIPFSLTVEVLKKKAAKRLNSADKDLILVFDGKELSDDLRIFETNLLDGSTVRLLPHRGKGLIDTVKTLFNDAYNSILKLVDWFPKYFRDNTRKLTEKDLANIANAIGKNWELLGFELGLKQVQMDQISEDFKTVVGKITGMLLKWRNQNPHEATVRSLDQAMKKCRQVSFDWTDINRVFFGI